MPLEDALVQSSGGEMVLYAARVPGYQLRWGDVCKGLFFPAVKRLFKGVLELGEMPDGVCTYLVVLAWAH